MFWILLGLAALAILLGARALVLQLRSGLSATGLNDRFSWGVYIQGFLTLASIAGGVLLFAGVEALVAPASGTPALASAIALGCLAGGGIMLGADLGKPFRSLLLILAKNPNSAMTWDFFAFGACGGLAGLAVLLGIFGIAPGPWWGGASVAVALSFLLVHVLLLLARQGSASSEPFLALEIIARAVWSGAGLLALCLGPEAGRAEIFLAASFFAALTHAAACFARPRPEKSGIRAWFSPLFPADGLVILLALGAVYGGFPCLASVGGFLTLFILAWEKMHLVKGLQESAQLPAPYSQWEERPAYKPSSLELQICLGSIGLAVFIAQAALLILRVTG